MKSNIDMPSPAVPAVWPLLVPLPEYPEAREVALKGPVQLLGAAKAGANGVHVIVVNDHGATFIRDISGEAGLCIDGTPMDEVRLKEGAIVRLGKVAYRFQAGQVGPHSNGKPELVARIGWTETSTGGRASDATSVVLEKPVVLIGSGGMADVKVTGEGVSDAHAVVLKVAGRWVLRDLDTGYATTVNGNPVKHAELIGGDVIRVGSVDLRFSTSPMGKAVAVSAAPPASPGVSSETKPEPITVQAVVAKPVVAQRPAPPVQDERAITNSANQNEIPVTVVQAVIPEAAPQPALRNDVAAGRDERLEKAPESFANWGPLARAVTATRDPRFFETAPVPPVAAAKRRRWWIGGMLVLLLGAAGAALWYFRAMLHF